MLLSSCGPAQVQDAPYITRKLPQLEELPKIEVCWLEYERGTGPGWIGTAGDTELETFNGTVSGLLIRHPRGDYLIDVGPSVHFKKHSKEAGFFKKYYLRALASRTKRVATTAEALRAVGADPKRLRKILITHIHFDHAGGLADLPPTKVLMDGDEYVWIRKTLKEGKKNIHVLPTYAKLLERNGVEKIRFNDGQYEVFPESANLTGDRTVVVVKMPGHTPGSVGVFVNLDQYVRLFLIGDTTNVMEGYQRKRHKSWPLAPTDVDREATGLMVSRVHDLSVAAPEVVILPSHDRDAWERFFGPEPRCMSVQ